LKGHGESADDCCPDDGSFSSFLAVYPRKARVIKFNFAKCCFVGFAADAICEMNYRAQSVEAEYHSGEVRARIAAKLFFRDSPQ
jgi:hypothetical protein